MQPGNLVHEPFQLPLMLQSADLHLLDYLIEFKVGLGGVGVFLFVFDLNLAPQAIDHFTEQGILIKELGIIFEQDVQLALQIINILIFYVVVFGFFIQIGRIDDRTLLTVIGVSVGRRLFIVSVIFPLLGQK